MADLWLPHKVRDDKHPIRRLTYSDTGEPKAVLHTTESKGKPSYNGWLVTPHGSIEPLPRRGVRIFQHIPLNLASFSLVNAPSGPQTNRDNCTQWELIGTCDPKRKKDGLYYWPEADDAVLLALWRYLVQPLRELRGVHRRPIPGLTRWQSYPGSYGVRKPAGKTNEVRLTAAQWDQGSGWCGHQHVPENWHGDPGRFPWSRMAAVAHAAGLV